MKKEIIKTEADKNLKTVLGLLLIVFVVGLFSCVLAFLERDEDHPYEGKKQLFDQEQKIVLQGDTMTVNIYGEIIK